MNINIDFKIPIKDKNTQLKFKVDLLLTPFYVTESEVLSTYLDEWNNKQVESARNIIFKNSLEADRLVGRKFTHQPKEEVFMLKRQLVLCMSVRDFGNRFNSDYISSLSRTKTLAEFTVSTSSNNNPQFVINTIDEAKQCVDDIKEAISLLGAGLISTFVKGSLNNQNNNGVYRLWHHFNLPAISQQTTASVKRPFNGRYYKNGGLR